MGNKIIKHSLVILVIFLCCASHGFSQNNKPCVGGSFEIVKPFIGIWEEYTVTDKGEEGGSAKYHWIVDGDDVIQRRVGGSRKIDYMHQLRLTVINEDLYEAMEEHSVDKGITWQKKELTRIRRKK